MAERDVARVLEDFHDAAARADEARYFGHFAADAVFLGTDATERWDVAAFRAYAHPHFASGHGWVYHPQRRSIAFAADGTVAWFEEDLMGERAASAPSRSKGSRCRSLSCPSPPAALDGNVVALDATARTSSGSCG
jgi:hypothetical protein